MIEVDDEVFLDEWSQILELSFRKGFFYFFFVVNSIYKALNRRQSSLFAM